MGYHKVQHKETPSRDRSMERVCVCVLNHKAVMKIFTAGSSQFQLKSIRSVTYDTGSAKLNMMLTWFSSLCIHKWKLKI